MSRPNGRSTTTGFSPVDLYFPPPPTTSTSTNDTKKCINFSFKSRGSTESSSDSVELKKQPKSILKKSVKSTKRTRQWILLAILIFSFTILILSTIFAYCAALPHSDNIAEAQESAAAASALGDYHGPVTSTIGLTAPTASPTSAAQQDTHDIYRRDTPTIAAGETDISIEDALAEDAINQARFSTRSAIASLTFYTITLPLLTMLHTATELLTSLVRPETSQSTRAGDILRFRTADAKKMVSRRRIGTLLSFSAAALLCLGWVIIQFFTLNCEIITFGPSSESVCPVQIRGHRMGGVSDLSVGKVGLIFLVIFAYAAYCIYLVRVVGVFGGKNNVNDLNVSGNSRVSSFRRRARFAARSGDNSQLDFSTHIADKRTQNVESVVIGIDMAKEVSTPRMTNAVERAV